MKERKYKKQVVELISIHGDRLVEPNAIQQQILGFYQSLIGAASRHTTIVNKKVLRNGPMLSTSNRRLIVHM